MATKKYAKTTSPYHYQYAAKFVCTANIPGTSQTSDSVLPGVYQTAVNIHNPNEKEVRFRMKLAVPGMDPTKFKDGSLKPDYATRFTCRQIQDFGVTFIHGAEGFLVIESTASLDVTAVYTASASGGQVSSIDVEQVKERSIR